MKSWNDQEELEDLARKARIGEIVQGVVRSSSFMKIPVIRGNGQTQMVEEETLIIALPGGITGYCPASEFWDRDYSSMVRFIGTTQNFIITRLDQPTQMALLSEKQAGKQIRDSFWDDLIELDKNDSLQDETYDAIVVGYNQQKGVVHLRINNQDAYMYRSEWSWSERPIVDAQNGEKIQVKIIQIEPNEKLVRTSRKLAQPDPFDFITKLKVGQLIAGRVEAVHPVHGLFVEVENGVVLKAGKVRALEEPEKGDFVTCRVRSINAEERKGKLMIINYPRGKRKKKDLGSFLFE
ncbi:hypothetical protein [Bacillus cihuensis]|uniref:hypothetical protein n=1 Tax=Bacillus cihuensis TaxID=1208599 RepID=UPI0003F6A8F0|nr:hypothetical protein [Bacillus cihuensis]